MTLCFAVLAHAHPEALAQQVGALRALHPGSTVVVFNGGNDSALTVGLDVAVCPSSRPLRHGHLATFHGLVMQWLAERDFTHLVTLDSDVLPVRAGLAKRVAGTAYAGAHLGQVQPGTPWRPGRRFLREWPTWRPLLGTEHPWRCFNPVQVFGREYVDAFLALPVRDELMDRVERSRSEALEEIVWPTLAVSMGFPPAKLPGDGALRLRAPTPYELRDHVADPDVFFVHKVGMALDAPERRLIREHLAGQGPDYDAAQAVARIPRPESRTRALAAWGKDAAQVLRRG